MQNFGLGHVLDTYLQGLTMQGFDSVHEIHEFQYEAACRNTTWNLDTPTRYACNYGSQMNYIHSY